MGKASKRLGNGWKDKILDYEIETFDGAIPFGILRLTGWKDKILDYEIETSFGVGRRGTVRGLKR